MHKVVIHCLLLSENLQKEVIDNVLNCISRPNLFLTDEIQFTKELFQAFHSHDSLIEILFSGSQSTVLPIHIENALKDYIFKQIPEYKDSAKFNIMLSYRIQGGFHAYRENYKRFSLDDITETPVSPFCPSITSNECSPSASVIVTV